MTIGIISGSTNRASSAATLEYLRPHLRSQVVDLAGLSELAPSVLAEALRVGGVAVPHVDVYAVLECERFEAPAWQLAVAVLLVVGDLRIVLPSPITEADEIDRSIRGT